MTARLSTLAASLLTFLWLVIAPNLRAQDVTNATNTGYPENAIIHGTEIESVQVTNGDLHVQIPIWSAKGRGLDTAGMLVYDNKEWFLSNRCFSSGICLDTVTSELNSNMVLTGHGPTDYTLTWKLQTKICGTNSTSALTTNVVLREPNGTKHHFSPDPVAYPGEPFCGTAVAGILYANDGSGLMVKLSSLGVPLYAVSKDGATANGLEDSNGNQITSTDTLGRTIYNGGLTYVDSSGTQRSATITSTTSVTVATQMCTFSEADGCTEHNNTWTVPSVVNVTQRNAVLLRLRTRARRGDHLNRPPDRRPGFVHLWRLADGR